MTTRNLKIKNQAVNCSIKHFIKYIYKKKSAPQQTTKQLHIQGAEYNNGTCLHDRIKIDDILNIVMENK